MPNGMGVGLSGGAGGGRSTANSTVKITHARSDENGNISGGLAGDQTKLEICTSDWYANKKGWYVLHSNNSSVRTKIAACANRAASNNHIGYNQSTKSSGWQKIKAVNWDPLKITEDIDLDCSSLVSVCVNYAGISVPEFTTSTLPSVLEGTGEFTKTSNDTKVGLYVGDILCTRSKGHTCIVTNIDGIGQTEYDGGAVQEAAAQTQQNNSVGMMVAGNTNVGGAGGREADKEIIKIPEPTIVDFNLIFTVSTETTTRQVERDLIKSVTVDLDRTKSTSLLTVPTYVETPFVILEVNGFIFGTNSSYSYDNGLGVNFPNFITRLEVSKVNGTVNQYTILLVYLIREGDDPNLVDKIFSSAGLGGKVKISYGDWAAPSFIYKEEEAIITKVSTTVDFSGNRITYSVSCTSEALTLLSTTYSFDATSAKPSRIILNFLDNNLYGITDIFTGMKNSTTVNMNNWIASDDQVVSLDEKKNIDVISYINYLVSCMVANEDTTTSELKTASYYMTIHDDLYNNLGGTYFTVTKVQSNSYTLSTADTYEIDVGFGEENTTNVLDFKIVDDNSWSLLYNYSDSLNVNSRTFDIDDNGIIKSTYSPNLLTSSSQYKMTESQRDWWTKMTLYPIQATLTIKGLLRPVMLMSYVRINALFYGQRHSASGLYFITSEKDVVAGDGYRTTLTLQRFAGDSDYIERTTVTETVTRTRLTAASKVLAGENSSSALVILSSEETTEFYTSGMTEGYAETPDDVVTPDGISYSSGSISEDEVWKYLMSQINNAYGVAGIMGNIKCEGGFGKFNRLEDLCKQKCYNGTLWPITYTNESYTRAVDKGLKMGMEGMWHDVANSHDASTVQQLLSGRYSNRTDNYKYPGGDAISRFEFCCLPKSGSVNGTGFAQYGYGMCQWTSPNRKAGLWDMCSGNNTSIADPNSQLAFLIYELNNTYASVGTAMRSATSVDTATTKFYNDFEGPDSSDTSLPTRKQYANAYYNKYAGK